MPIKSIQRILSPEHLAAPYQIAQKLIGEVCWEAYFSYGDELVLNLGERIPYNISPKAQGEHGSWVLGTLGTNWELKRVGQVVLTSDADPKVMRQQSKQLEGHRISAVDIGYPRLDLVLTFDDALQLHVLPIPEDDEYEEIAYWELFTPDHYVLSVGPNSTWSYVPSNTPA